MTTEEISNNVKEFYLDEAKESLSQHGRYWNSGILRKSAQELQHQLRNEGFDVSYQEIKPIYEHVFYLPDYKNDLDEISNQRAYLLEADEDKCNLPV